jgi:single-strand DNA-binding protein
MSTDTNRTVLIGRLTRAPELRHTNAGTAICSFDLAFNRSIYSKQTGETREEVGYAPVKAWGKMGENLSKHIDKGSRVCVDGYLRWESWEKEGVKHSRLYLNADSVQFLDVNKTRERGPLDGGSFNDDTAKRFRDDDHVMTGEPPF